MFKKSANKKNTAEENNIIISSDITDFRFLSPLNPEDIDFSYIENTNSEFIRKGKIDDATPNYREPLIDATLNEYSKYLDGHMCEAIHLWRNIISGATAQKDKCSLEEEYIKKIPIEELIG